MTSNDKKKSLNVPPLRFPEFKGEWVLTSLSELCGPFEYGLNEPAVSFDGLHKYLRITDIDESTSTFKDDGITSPAEFDDSCKMKENDIVFARTGASVGKTYLYDKKDGCLYYAGFLIRANIRKGNPYFVFSETKRNKFIKWVKLMSARSGQPGINSKEYASYSFFAPSQEEQDKISLVVNLVDRRINVQRKIIEDLILKRNALSNSITQTLVSSNVKLRETNLSDVLSERKTFATKGSLFQHVTLAKEGIIPKTERYNRDFLVRHANKEYKVTHKNDICYNPANLKFGVITINQFGDAIFSPIYVTFEVNKPNNPYYMSLLLTSKTFLNHIRRYEQGTVYERMAVLPEDFLKGKVYLPDSLIQSKISDLFICIANKINIERGILKQLFDISQYLLNEMFC